jgi:hypothetical protein
LGQLDKIGVAIGVEGDDDHVGLELHSSGFIPRGSQLGCAFETVYSSSSGHCGAIHEWATEISADSGPSVNPARQRTRDGGASGPTVILGDL